jgi:hypothetical protein
MRCVTEKHSPRLRVGKESFGAVLVTLSLSLGSFRYLIPLLASPPSLWVILNQYECSHFLCLLGVKGFAVHDAVHVCFPDELEFIYSSFFRSDDERCKGVMKDTDHVAWFTMRGSKSDASSGS